MLEAGADPLQRDDYGRAPSDVASSERLRQQLWGAAGVRTAESTGVDAEETAVAAEEVGAETDTHAQTERESDREGHAVGDAGGWSVTSVGGGIGRRHNAIKGLASAPRHCDFDVVDAAEMDNARFRR